MPGCALRYYAFLSYSHKDEELADWLHRELEQFRVPHALAGKLTANGVVPRRLTPIFRDQHELAAADDLGDEIDAALAASQFLVVLCSPDRGQVALDQRRDRDLQADPARRLRACRDRCGRAIRQRHAGARGRGMLPARAASKIRPPRPPDRQSAPSPSPPIFAKTATAGGSGSSSWSPGCSASGSTSWSSARPPGASAGSHARRGVAGGMAVTSTLAVTAIQARDAAREQRREAEGLVGFMLGDFKDKLEPIGRLDALDGVGARVLAYYQQAGHVGPDRRGAVAALASAQPDGPSGGSAATR